jgi:lysozyme family protein
MASANFERCLAVTLKWEGGYSNHPDDPGGPTMRGIIQREYDTWRKKWGKRTRPVKQIEEAELRTIYRAGYWDAMGCDSLAAGMDLCVFDAAVNSGVSRARVWQAQASDVDTFCDARLTFLQRLGRLWRVFGAGWARRVAGIRNEAHLMAGNQVTIEPHDASLHAGMVGPAVRELQARLRTLGYPAGNVDGIYGEQTFRAVVIFQHDHDLKGDAGVWLPEYAPVLAEAQPMLPKRREADRKDMEAQGDKPIQRFNLLQRIFAWLFGASAVAQVTDAQSVMDSVSGFRMIVEPAAGLIGWAASNRWLLVAVACLALIAFVRFMRARHVEAYQNFTYQGDKA